MMGLKDIFVRIIAFVANMVKCMKNLLMAAVAKTYDATKGTVEMFHMYMGLLLLLYFIVISSVQIFGHPIDCTIKGEDAAATKIAEDTCWHSKSFSFPENSNYNTKEVYEASYQTAPMALFLQGMLFLLVSDICTGSQWLSVAFCSLKQFHGHRFPKIHDVTPNVAVITLASHIFLLANVLLNLFYVDSFLGHAFTNCGFGIMLLPYLEQSTRNDVILTVFPRVIRCNMDKVDFCFLPINILNEKIFVTLCLWFLSLATLICLQIFLDLAHLLFCRNNNKRTKYTAMQLKPKRVKMIKNRLIDIEACPGEEFRVRIFNKPPKDTRKSRKLWKKCHPRTLGVLDNKENGGKGDVLVPVSEELP